MTSTPHPPRHAMRPGGSRALWLMIAVLLPLGACDTSFDPVVENDTAFFSLFGYLDARADTQFIRVTPVREVAALPDGRLDATVTSRQPGTPPVVWQDSLVRLDDGTTGFLYFAPLSVQRGVRYDLAIRQAEDGATFASVELPDPTTLSVREVTLSFLGRLEQDVVWDDVSTRPNRVVMYYCVRTPGEETPQWISRVMTDPGERLGDDWTITVPLEEHRSDVLQRLGRPSQDGAVELHELAMEIDELGPEWFLRDPATEIRNGFGFFSSVVRHTDSWTLSSDDLVRLNYAVPSTPLLCGPLP